MQQISTKNYFSLCGIRFCSSVVLWLDFILIFSTLTFIFDASAQTLALAASLYGIPALLFGPYLGSLADRFNPCIIISVSFCIRFIASCALFVAPSVELFLAFTMLKGLSNLGSTAAEVVLTRNLLTAPQIIRNTSLIMIIDQTVKIVSPLAAGILTGLSFKSAGFLLSAFVCLCGLLFVTLLSARIMRSEATCPLIPKTSNRQIYNFFKKQLTARIFLMCILSQSAALGLYDSLLSLLLKGNGQSATSFGVIVSATALGGIFAGFLFPRLYRSGSRICSTIASMCFGLAVLAVGSLSFFPAYFELNLLSLLFLLAGFAYGLTTQGLTTTLQLTCPPNKLGTTFATVRTLSIALFISFPILGGWLAELANIASVLLAAGISTTLIACTLHITHRTNHSESTSPRDSATID
ncbi:MFS transporter [Pseudomonas sp. LF19]|uniref:MFS transporter n=1 Tax=Pseudomonas sp. LF19 TaxID=2899115 RepID=UPI001F2A305C|nr:MFS transporter [Pseudomonas sp. LF19]MCE5983357.1 MFS transporter [Pseudomonas sp. LF19]